MPPKHRMNTYLPSSPLRPLAAYVRWAFAFRRRFSATVLFLMVMFLQAVGAYGQTDRIGIHVTQAELEVWRDRAANGPYKDRGDAGYKTPADWTYITENANAFLNNPSGDRFTQFYSGIGCVPEGYHDPTLDLGIETRDAAFYSLVQDDAGARDDVLQELLWHAAQPELDFGDRTLWCTDPANSLGGDNAFIYAEWTLRLLFAYDYIRPYVSSTDRSTLDAWFHDAGHYFQENIDNELARLFDDRANGVLSGRGTTLVNDVQDGQLTHIGGWQINAFNRQWNNRRSTQVRYVAMAGIQQNDSVLIESAKQWVKDVLKYGIFPDGVPVEYHRSHTYEASKGWSYAGVTISHMGEIANHLARAGDIELLEYSTTDGAGESTGGPKSIRNTVEHFFSTMDGSVQLYNLTGTEGNSADLLDGFVESENRFYAYDMWFAGVNNYWNDDSLQERYLEIGPEHRDLEALGATDKNTGPHPPWGGSGDVYPGIMFMFADMESLVDPYPADAPKQGLTPTTTSLEFGTVEIGTTTVSTTVTLSNDTSEPIRVTSIFTTASAFPLTSSPAVPFDVQPGGSFDVSVSFSPDQASSFSEQLIVQHDTVSTDVTVTLRGTGAIATEQAMIAEYDFHPGTDTQILLDRTGNGFDGTLGSTTGADDGDPTWTDDGLYFDGTNDFVSLGDVFDVTETEDVTVLVYFRPEVSHRGDLWVKRAGSETAFSYLRLDSDALRVQYRDASGEDVVNVNPFGGSLPAGSYAMASMRLENGTDAVVGLNDDQTDATTLSTGHDFSSGAGAYFGAYVDGVNRFNPFQGTLAYARVYNYALTDAELADVYTEIQDRVEARGSTRAIPLHQGWNLVGSAVSPDTPDMEVVLEGVQQNLSEAQDENGEVYIPGTIDELGTWDPQEGYILYLEQPDTLVVQGTAIDPGSTTISLTPGWNLVPYIPRASMPVEDAFQSISGALVMVKDEVGNVYMPDSGINTIGTVDPDHAYKVFLNTEATLSYP